MLAVSTAELRRVEFRGREPLSVRLDFCCIENFRALQQVRLGFDDTTLLVGENGCGKSSLLKAIEVCLGRGAPCGDFSLSPRDFHRTRDRRFSKQLTIELGFIEQEDATESSYPKLRDPALLTANGWIEIVLKVQARRLNDTDPPEVEFSITGPGGPCQDPTKVLAELRRVLPYLTIKQNFERPKAEDGMSAEERARQEVEWHVRAALNEIVDTDELPVETLQQVHQALDDVVARFEGRASEEPRDSETLILAPMSSSTSWQALATLLKGSGARSYAMLAFVAAFLRASGVHTFDTDVHPIVAIQEPEANLHPLMVSAVWDLVQRLPTQKLVTTNSGDLLAAASIDGLRRLVRDADGRVKVFMVPNDQMSLDDLRKVAYHLRVRRGTALFMRTWILVEGESEFWLLTEAARAMDIDLRQEGIDCLEFAQSGLIPLATLANHLGIDWQMLADGDRAGEQYRQQAEPLTQAGLGQIAILRDHDLEHLMWNHGYASVYRQAAGITGKSRKDKAHDVIPIAIKMHSKPRLALMLGDAMRAPDSPGVPKPLADIILQAVARARAHGP